MAEVDPFEGCEPYPGLEHLGRAILTPAGLPSGSPANYENLRGRTTLTKPPDPAVLVANIADQFKDFEV